MGPIHAFRLEIQRLDAVRLFGPHAVRKDVAQDGCSPDLGEWRHLARVCSRRDDPTGEHSILKRHRDYELTNLRRCHN
jgi:hypothetical protein